MTTKKLTPKERHEQRNEALIKEMHQAGYALINCYNALKDSAGFKIADDTIRGIIEYIHLKR